MAEICQRNRERITAWVSQQVRLRDPVSFIDPFLIENPDHSTVYRYPVCFDIPRLPIIPYCKHVLCHDSFTKIFQKQLFNNKNSYFTKCPECRTIIKPDDIHTFSQEKNSNPASAAVSFYSSIRVFCDNAGCNKFIDYENLYEHEFFQCTLGRMSVPAQRCLSIAPPDLTLCHTLDCPLHFIWCGTCLSKYSCVIYGHSCEKMLQRQLLLGQSFSKEP